VHDVPTAAQLVEAVREFVERDVMAATEGRVNFHARVAVNVLRMVERELSAGDEPAAAHERGLRQLGVGSERELADAIRHGRLDDRAGEVRAFVAETVRAKLDVANPQYR
jgi:hypothetical protein